MSRLTTVVVGVDLSDVVVTRAFPSIDPSVMLSCSECVSAGVPVFAIVIAEVDIGLVALMLAFSVVVPATRAFAVPILLPYAVCIRFTCSSMVAEVSGSIVLCNKCIVFW